MTRKLMHIISAALVITLCLAPAIVFAHGTEQHIRGYVINVSGDSIAVKTTAGKVVEVAVDAKTTFTRSQQPIQKAEIKAGDRIVIHAADVKGKLVAHTVQIGTPAVAKQASKH